MARGSRHDDGGWNALRSCSAARRGIPGRAADWDEVGPGAAGRLDEILADLSGRRVEDVDRTVGTLIAEAACPMYGRPFNEVVDCVVVPFVQSHRSTLEWVLRRHRNDPMLAALIDQPEVLLAMERLHVDPDALVAGWPAVLPRAWLQALSEHLGVPV